jgi:hypothetical protein
MNQKVGIEECKAAKTEEGLLTRNADGIVSQLWNMENTVDRIESLVNKLRSPKAADKALEGKPVEPFSIYEKYTHITDRIEVLYKRLEDISQELGVIV